MLMRAGIRQQAMSGPAWTIAAEDGRVIAVGGLSIQWPGFALAWAYVLDHSTHSERMEAARIGIRKFRESSALGLRRIEATTRADFPQAEAFVARLGFKADCLREKYGPDGADHILWAKVAA